MINANKKRSYGLVEHDVGIHAEEVGHLLQVGEEVPARRVARLPPGEFDMTSAF